MDFYKKELNKNNYGVYCIINVISGNAYVGQTRQPFIKRYYHHRWKLRNGTHDNGYLQRAWNLYGENNFTFIVIENVKTVESLDALEIKYINFYRSINHSYNLIDGGSGGHRGIPLSNEHKRKISEKNRINMTGRKHSIETRQKMSNSRKGRILNINNCILSPDIAYDIKSRLVRGDNASTISKEMNIEYKLINNIISSNAWSSVYVSGWDEYRKSRKTYSRLTQKDHEIIYQLHIENGYTKYQLASMYDKGVKMIEYIFREQRKKQIAR